VPNLREKLTQSAPTFGSWVAIGNTLSAELMGRTGFDWLIVDTQHGGLGEAELLAVLQTLEATSTPALVRIDWLDEARIMRAVDLGAAGVIVPMVNTAADAKRAVAAIRYPPQGIRSFGPVRNYFFAGGVSVEPLCVVMIETLEALENLDEIAATPGLDGLFLGPIDMGFSMGLGLHLEMPAQVLDAVDRIVAACRRHDLLAGSVALGLANAQEQIRRGMQFLTSGNDALFIRRGASQELDRLRQLGTDR
jgi:4-hydroxy-2-oxoheptanedioate aldolase